MGKLKTVGIEEATHRELKTLCAMRGWTMTEAVQHMLDQIEKEVESDGRSKATDESGKEKRARRTSPSGTDKA